MDDLQDYLNSLSYPELIKVLNGYSEANSVDLTKTEKRILAKDFDERLEALGINSVCPKCESSEIVKFGKPGGVQAYRCKKCGHKFNRFSGTILEKTKWSYEAWLKVLELTLNDIPLLNILNILVEDLHCVGLDYKTVWLWRHKLIHALAQQPMPVLSGVVQMDETFIREAQKGSRSLVSTLSKTTVRHPRYGRRASEMGVLGPEFANVVTAVDASGHCVCITTSLGPTSVNDVIYKFNDYIKNASFLCTDGNPIYSDYCKMAHIRHYIKPSTYLDTIQKAGFNPYAETKVEQLKNDEILERLYEEEEIDYIEDKRLMSFKQFNKIKKDNGLSLGRVNELHADIKSFVYTDMTNVSTKYLQDYIGFFTFRRNWRVDHKRYPTTSKDAEEIFETILKSKVNYTLTNIKNQEIECTKPSPKYISVLRQKTAAARAATRNKYFKFNSEDGTRSFNKVEYLNDRNEVKLHRLAKEYGYKGFRKWPKYTLVLALSKEPDILDKIYQMIQNERSYIMDDEDYQELKSRGRI